MKQRTEKQIRRDVAKMNKMVTTALDQIYKSCKKMSKKYGTEFIPFNTFEEVIKLRKLKVNSDIPQANEMAAAFNKMLESMKSDLRRISRKMGTNNIPLVNIKKAVDICKKQF
jgi:hypothetical protein